MNKSVYIEEESLGSFYRINGGELEWQPVSLGQTEPIEDDWGAVEKDLVGDEPCNFRGEEMTLNDAYVVIERELSELNSQS